MNVEENIISFIDIKFFTYKYKKKIQIIFIYKRKYKVFHF